MGAFRTRRYAKSARGYFQRKSEHLPLVVSGRNCQDGRARARTHGSLDTAQGVGRMAEASMVYGRDRTSAPSLHRSIGYTGALKAAEEPERMK